MSNEKNKKFSEMVANVSDGLSKAASATADTAKNIANKTKDAADKTKEAVVAAIDTNGNGQIDIEDIIVQGLRIPGTFIDRADFLRKEFYKLYTADVIEKAVATTPMKAGIDTKDVDKIADAVIQAERTAASGISAALGAPGGLAMMATVPADIIQYYSFMLRAIQKLLYLYGFPQLDDTKSGNKLDSETLNIITLCLGVMFGVAEASNALRFLSQGLSQGLIKSIKHTAITKTFLYPILKKIANFFSVKMTREVLINMVDNSVPVLGAILGGTVTYFSFKPCCDKLKESLQNTMLSNPNYRLTAEEEKLYDDFANAIEVETY